MQDNAKAIIRIADQIGNIQDQTTKARVIMGEINETWYNLRGKAACLYQYEGGRLEVLTEIAADYIFMVDKALDTLAEQVNEIHQAGKEF